MCHIIFLAEREIWDKTPRVRRFYEKKNILPVQCWTYLWVRECENFDFIIFEEFSIRKLTTYLGERVERIPK